MAAWIFVTPAQAAQYVREAIVSGDVHQADRWITEMASNILLADDDAEFPPELFEQPESTGRPEYDALLATALAYALQRRGATPARWMLEAPRLDREWAWGDGYEATDRWRDYIRASTPALFLAKNILAREKDLVAP